jgi:hypothetical protein
MNWTIAEEARRYHREFGWNVIPIGAGRKPTCRWKAYQGRRQRRREIERLFNRSVSGLAVITGEVSRGLAIRDYDDADAYAQWAAGYPKLAEELPTAQTARGYHVYFRSRQPEFCLLGDGEYRGDSLHFTLLPPSVHPSGSNYKWITPPIPGRGGNLRFLDPAGCGLIAEGAARHTPGKGDRCDTQIINDSVSQFRGPESWESAVCRSLPTKERERNWCIFQLARRLRGLPDYANAKPEDLRPIVEEWHRRALPVIRTKDFSESWSDFLRAWPTAWPMCHSAVDVALRQAIRHEPPQAARYLSPQMRLLVAICWHLARFATPFYLSARDVARVLGIDGANSPMTAWRLLRTLERDGLLILVERGTAGQIAGGKATSYRFAEESEPSHSLARGQDSSACDRPFGQ